MDQFDAFFGQLKSMQGKEYIFEIGQDIGKKKLRLETLVLLSPEFNPKRPFMFRLTSNDQELVTAHGYSDIDKALKT